jgi:hypothetical protein
MIEGATRSVTAPIAVPGSAVSRTARFARQAATFALLGFGLYMGIYVFAEQTVNAHTLRNRFFVVKTAPLPRYDTVILGASHAAVLDYQDMNAHLEDLTGSHILNLSIVGGGVSVNRLMLDYVLSKHDVGSVLYVIDSFAFYSSQWNEDRFNDTQLYNRAPFDPALAILLANTPAARPELVDYVTGFSKINNQDRFKTDVTDDEAVRFDTTYQPIPQIDNQRLQYLYPNGADEAAFARYLGQFEDMVTMLELRHVHMTVIRPPLPVRVYRALPSESQFDQRLGAVLQRRGVDFHDFSQTCNDDHNFFNTDHLNRTGVLNFYQACLLPALGTPTR